MNNLKPLPYGGSQVSSWLVLLVPENERTTSEGKTSPYADLDTGHKLTDTHFRIGFRNLEKRVGCIQFFVFRTALDTIRLMTKEWKERWEKIAISVVTAVPVLVVTAIIKGDDLKGLGKVSGFFRILNVGIPLWLFLAVLVIAILGGFRWIKSRRREIVHVQWKPERCLWSVANSGKDEWMSVMLSAYITNSHPELGLIITSVYLEGTKPVIGLFETIPLPAAHVCDEIVNAMVEPLVVPEGTTFRGNVIFVDQFQRKHKAYIELRGHAAQPQPKPDAAKLVT